MKRLILAVILAAFTLPQQRTPNEVLNIDKSANFNRELTLINNTIKHVSNKAVLFELNRRKQKLINSYDKR